MAIVIYQTLIVVALLLAALAGTKRLFYVAGGLGLFTITHVFMPWLMVLQFCTIIVATLVGWKIASSVEERQKR